MKVFDKTDWPKLQAQKMKLLEAQELLKAKPDLFEAFEGLLNWIDAIQDYANDELGYPVFPQEKEDD